tara:strand:+ start:425 stop:1000 length:576 start_codon:yes stop_codon:yes gene_type:complete
MFDEYKYAYYYALRTEARDRVVKALNNKIKQGKSKGVWANITLASIDNAAISYSRKEWPKYYNEDTHTGFDHSWETLYHKFIPNPANYNIAIWQQVGDSKILQGLALGEPSKGKTHLVVKWIERSFAPTYFKGGILLPVLACAEEYAKLLGCQRVLIKDPRVDEGTFEKYGYAPYRLSQGGNYLSKELDHG